MIDRSYLLKYLQPKDKILLYGKGRNVYLNYEYLKDQSQFQIVGIITPNADQVIDPAIPMYYPHQLETIAPACYDKVIITVRDQEMGLGMYQAIREAGVDEKKIVAAHIYLGPATDISLKDFIESPIRLRQEIEKFIGQKYRNLHYFDPLVKELKANRAECEGLRQQTAEILQPLSPLESIVFLYIMYLADIFDAGLMKSLMESVLKIDQPELRNFLHGIYYDTISMTFLHEDYLFPEYYVLRRSFTKKLCEMYRFCIDADCVRKSPDGTIRKILIVVGSLRDHKHAPTLTTMELCRILVNLGYEVRVMPLDTHSNIAWEFPVFGPAQGLAYYGSREFEEYHKEALHPKVSIEYTDIVDPKDKMQRELNKILEFSPDLIIDLGTESSIISYIYSGHFPTLCFPLNGCQSSTYFTHYAVLDHRTFTEANEIFHSVDPECQVKCPSCMITPSVQTKYERGSYSLASINSDDFVLISVGNRIGSELTESFINVVCKRLLSKEGIKWLIVGGTNEYLSQRYQELLETGKIVYIPYEKDLPALYQICDVYISPKRRGGGTSVFWAMYYGLPVAQPWSSQADAYTMMGTETRVIETDEQMAEYVLELWREPRKYAEDSDNVKKRALQVEAEQKQGWGDIIEKIGNEAVQKNS